MISRKMDEDFVKAALVAKVAVDKETADAPGHQLRVDIISKTFEYLEYIKVPVSHYRERLARADRTKTMLDEIYNLRELLKFRYPDGLIV